jgi:predicted dehydrogenase
MDRPFSAGIASFGMSGRVFHAPLLAHHPAFHLKRIVERSTSDAHALYPGALISRSVGDLLSDPALDLIVVNTPDQDHYGLAKSCLEAGKHVVVEKPFTQTVGQGEELIELASSKNRILSVFQNRRWDGDFLTVRKVIDGGALGRIVEYESHFDRFRPAIQRASWKEDPESGTGLLWNLGSHMIDQALSLFGMPGGISAHLRIVRNGGAVNDWFDLHLQYPSLMVALKASYLAREPRPRFLLHGDRGSYVKYGVDPQEEALKRGSIPDCPGWGMEAEGWWGLLHTEQEGVARRERFPTIPGNYSAYYDNIAAAIAGGETLAVTASQALDVIRIIDLARRSEGEGGHMVAVRPPG